MGSSSLKTFEAYDPPALKRGGDPMVTGHYFRLVKKDTGASAKRKKNQSSPSFRKKQKTYVLYGFQGQSRGYQGQGRVRASSHTGQMTCYHFHQPGHMKLDCPQRRGSRSYGTPHTQSSMGLAHMQFLPPYPSMGQGNRY